MESQLSFIRRKNYTRQPLFCNLPVFFSLFKIPEGVAAEIQRLQNQFLWKGQQASNPHLIKWKTVLSGTKTGGLALGGIIEEIKYCW